jgi:hypothetical protein
MLFFDPQTMGGATGEAMATTSALLFGRRTWQVMAAAWPARAGDPFADRMNEIDKYVVSRTLELVATTTSATGVHICTYRPVRGAPADAPGPSRHRTARRAGARRRIDSPIVTDDGAFTRLGGASTSVSVLRLAFGLLAPCTPHCGER